MTKEKAPTAAELTRARVLQERARDDRNFAAFAVLNNRSEDPRRERPANPKAGKSPAAVRS